MHKIINACNFKKFDDSLKTMFWWMEKSLESELSWPIFLSFSSNINIVCSRWWKVILLLHQSNIQHTLTPRNFLWPELRLHNLFLPLYTATEVYLLYIGSKTNGREGTKENRCFLSYVCVLHYHIPYKNRVPSNLSDFWSHRS